MKAHKLTKETILNLDQADRGFPEFNVGDTIDVGIVVKEGSKERVQSFLGSVISMHHKGVSSTFTIRRMGANNVGVEKILPFHSPVISSIKVVKRGVVRRAKLYYIRERIGKSARIKEKILSKKQLAAKAKKREAKVEKTNS